MDKYFIDIETNLAHDTLWCIGLVDEAGNASIHEDASTLPSPTDNLFVAHYGVIFDFPKLEELAGFVVPPENQIDTHIMSQLNHPNFPGGHSLKNLAIRSGSPLKDEFPLEEFDWGLTEKMKKYCMQDCRSLRAVFRWLLNQMKRWPDLDLSDPLNPVRMEQDVRRLTAQQIANGFKLDVAACNDLWVDMTGKLDDIRGDMQKVFPPISEERWSEKTGKRLKDKITVFNPGSRIQIASRLEGLGATWTEFTDKGNVSVNEETLLEKAVDYPEAKVCLDYLVTAKRLSQVNSWLKFVTPEGRVHGNVDTLGCITGRMSHSGPNMGQVDKHPPMRGVWTVDDGNVLVGVDASGLELHMLAHYMKDEDFIGIVLNGDPHWRNALAFGLTEEEVYDPDTMKSIRDMAKTLIYALIYGCGDALLGAYTGKSEAYGRRMRADFEQATPAYVDLLETLDSIANKSGTLPSLDGRRIVSRHDHTRCNTLMQGAGAVIMKRALINGVNTLDKCGVPFKVVAQVHDEIQVETPEQHGEDVKRAFIGGIEQAGEDYNLRLPLSGDGMIGKTWRDTH